MNPLERYTRGFLFLLIASFAVAQSPGEKNQAAVEQSPLERQAQQIAQVFGLGARMQKVFAFQKQRATDVPMSLEELSARQEFLEAVEAANLDVDSVIAELANEQSELGSIRTILQARRDKTVSRYTTASLISGSGAGTAVSATQFTHLSSTTQNVGDAIGVGSGALSTIFSILAARAQNGPSGTVDETPNMLAPLLGGEPKLRTYYPPAVLQYLRSIPPGEDLSRGTRLDQLLAQWDRAGRLPASDSGARKQKIAVLVSTGDPKVKVSIEDLTDRIAMLGDVRGRVALMKRDLAALLRSFTSQPK